MFGRERNVGRRETRFETPALVEAVEPRRMLSAATGAAGLVGGTLNVEGTRRSDVIEVSVNGADGTKLDVTIRGRLVGRFTLADVSEIRVNGGWGDDRVTIEGTLAVPAEILGGDGRDTLTGGGGSDRIHGYDGRDVLSGGAGEDVMVGGPGGDRLDGGDGIDDLMGNGGNDVLIGGAGDDSLRGGAGNDSLEGGAGNDTLNGERGDDDFYGVADGDFVRWGASTDRHHEGDAPLPMADNKAPEAKGPGGLFRLD